MYDRVRSLDMTRLALLVCPLAAALSAARAQTPDSTHADSAAAVVHPASRALCFGVSFDRGCRVMLQYEAGLRVRAVGDLPVGRGMWVASRSSVDFFVGGGLMFPLAPGRALGVVYQAGTEGPVHSLGARYARSLGGASRIDLTAGGTYLSTDVGGGSGPPHRGSSVGAFGEAALHANNYLTALAREETFFPTRDIAPRSRLLLGARLERGPAVVVSAAAAVLIGALIASWTGEDW